jgi:threonine/homoserine/homoserine lactone efflux protein
MPATLLPFLLFAFVSSITPGPTNILVLSNAARYGLLASVPSVLGACGGAALLVLAVGTGLGESLLKVPAVHLAMTAIGLLWLTWLAWKIYASPTEALTAKDCARKFGLVDAATLQLINPKTWMMALAVISVFTTSATDQGREVAWLSLAFFLVAVPCMGSWALLGAGSARWLKSPAALGRMNKILAVVLLICAWSSLIA